MTNALELRRLSKAFDRPAVDALDLTIAAGTFYALLGPNGAGKTTTLRMVAGLLEPDHGTVRVCGHDLADDPLSVRRALAWVPDEPLIYDRLSPLEYLELVARLWDVPPERGERAAQALLASLGLRDVATKRCGGFSKGMRQKVALAGALIHDPSLIILDEPLTGLDAGSSRRVKALLKERVAAGATVIMTTHILEVAERMAQRIGIIAGGRLVAEGTIGELQALLHAAAPEAGATDAALEDIFLGLIGDEAAGPQRAAA